MILVYYFYAKSQPSVGIFPLVQTAVVDLLIASTICWFATRAIWINDITLSSYQAIAALLLPPTSIAVIQPFHWLPAWIC